MKVDWGDRRCVVCLRERDSGAAELKTTRGHVFPEAIGGRLWAAFLCQRCNSKLGTIEEKLLADVSVVELALSLGGELPPDLARKLQARAGYFRDDPVHGRIYARPSPRTGDLELTTRDARTRRDGDVRKEIVRKLRAAGATDTDVDAALAAYEALPAGGTLAVAGDTLVKPIDVAGREFGRTYDEPIVPAVVPLGIAYLFLACVLGEGVYERELDGARAVLRAAVEGDEDAATDWLIDFLRPATDDAAPLLEVAFEDVGGEAAVRVVVFGWYVWRVRFPQIAPPARTVHYARYLDSGTEESNLKS